MADDTVPKAEVATEPEVTEEQPVKAAAPKKAASKKAAAKPAAKKSSAKGDAKNVTPGDSRFGKKYRAAATKVEAEKLYTVAEAVALAKETATTSFDSTVEIHLRLGVDPRQAEENIRGTVKLPAGTGKQVKVLVFAPEAKLAATKKAGADFVSDEATLKKVADGWTGWDISIATPDMMVEVGKLGKTLGPKGLMPNPKLGTVTPRPEDVIAEVKKGQIEFRVAKDATMHNGVGKVSFSAKDIEANLTAYLDAVQAEKPADLKGNYIQSVTVTTTMGPGISVDPKSL